MQFVWTRSWGIVDGEVMVELNGVVVVINVTCISQSVGWERSVMVKMSDQHIISLGDGITC